MINEKKDKKKSSREARGIINREEMGEKVRGVS